MPNNEILDVVDEHDNVIGQAPRSEVHKRSLIHRVIRCWVFNNQGQVLWIQRSLKKHAYPGFWDTCSGHIQSGGNADTTVIRELAEELGIDNAKPVFIEKYLDDDINHRAFYYLYGVICDQSQEKFQLDPSEIENVQWIDYTQAVQMYQNKEVDATDFIYREVPKILQKLPSLN